MRHLLIVVGIFAASMSGLIWLCRTVDPSTRYSSKVEFNYARYCAGCHGANGEGNGRIGRFKKLEPANLTTADFWDSSSDEKLIHSIDAGKDDMPAFFYYLTHVEQRELLDFIKENFRPTPAHN